MVSSTRVEPPAYSEPATIIDRLREIGAAGWSASNGKIALERLRLIFEEPPDGELSRATIAGYDPLKAARFGGPTGMDPGHPRRGEAAH